jgi:hypothetical protein
MVRGKECGGERERSENWSQGRNEAR